MPSVRPKRPTAREQKIVDLQLAKLSATKADVMHLRRLVCIVMRSGQWQPTEGLYQWWAKEEPTCIVGLFRRLFGPTLGSCCIKLLGLPQNYAGLLTRWNDDGTPPKVMATRLMAAPVKIWV